MGTRKAWAGLYARATAADRSSSGAIRRLDPPDDAEGAVGLGGRRILRASNAPEGRSDGP